MIKCMFCDGQSTNNEFCSICGKTFRNIDKGFSSGKGLEWEEEVLMLRCLSKKSNLLKGDVVNSKFIMCPDYINEGSKKVYYEVTSDFMYLDKYIEKRLLSSDELIDLVKRLIDIFMDFESRNLILDSVGLNDFIIFNDDLKTIKYCQTRKFGNVEDIFVNNDITSEYISPEVMAGKKADFSNNVYLLGKLFSRLLIGRDISYEIDEERYLLYNIQIVRPDFPCDFHEFLFKITSLYSFERYKNISEVCNIFNSILNKSNRKSCEKSLRYKVEAKTHVGFGKLHKASGGLVKTDEEGIYNEDMMFCDRYSNKQIIAVGDGVSTARYGSGKKASRILKDNLNKCWDMYKESISSKDDFISFIRDVCKSSGEDIVSDIKDDVVIVGDSKSLSGVMATTFVVAVMIDNIMYYCSIGDSFIYKCNPYTGLSLMNLEDNVLNDLLKSGVSWKEANKREDKDYISNFVGEVIVNNGSLKPIEPKYNIREVFLEKGDVIMLCSDGITDYVTSSDYSDNLWNIDSRIKQILVNNELTLEEKANTFIEESNKNGGGDNLTIVLAEVI